MAAPLRRAWSCLIVKSVDEDQRIIEGIATTPSTDRMGDVVEPKGAQFNLPIPLLWQHDANHAEGLIHTTEEFATIAEPGKLKDRLDEAWQSVKSGLVGGLSIGFQSLEQADISGTWGVRFIKWLWLELSAVTIPANAEASISLVKSCDTGLAASGASGSPTKPGATGHSGAVYLTAAKAPTMTIADQIKSLEATRAAKLAEFNGIQTKAVEEGRTKDVAEKERFDTLKGEIEGIDVELKDLRDSETLNAAAAKAIPASAATDQGVATAARGRTNVIQVSRELPKGILFARYAMCIGASRGLAGEAMRLAKEHYPDDPGVFQLVQKTAVAGGSTSGSHYLDDMVPYSVMADFIEYLRPGSIIGKFGGPNPGGGGNYPSLNRVGFNQRVSGMSTGYTAGWKGEGLPALPSAAVTFNTSLPFHNMSALAVLTKEAIRFSNPNAESKVRDDLARAVNYKLDYDFVDPAKAVSGTTSPASITYGVAAIPPTGTTAAYLRTNLASLIATFATNKLDPADIVLIMSAQMALQISMMTNTLGNADFPDITMKGGTLRGFPVIVSELLTGVGSPSTQTIIAVKASDVYLADDGVVTVEASDQASLEMVDTSSQSAISGTGASLVSLWQTGAVGLMATREITWKLRRATAVQYISPAAYVA